MPVPQRNASAAANGTTISSRYYPPPGFTQATIGYANSGSVVLTFLPYAIEEGSGKRVALETAAISIAAGAADMRTYVGTFSSLEVDVYNAHGSTVGSFTWSVQLGGE